MKRALIVIYIFACSPPVATFVTSGAAPSAAGAVVKNGLTGDSGFQNSTTTTSANWSGFSGADHYEDNASTTAACAANVAGTQVSKATSDTSPVALAEGQTFFHCVRAIGADGQHSDWVTSGKVTVDTTPPLAPAVLNAASGYSEVGLSWSPVSDGGSGLASYEVGYCQGAGCTPPDPPQVTGLTTNSVSVTPLANCASFTFFSRARDAAGNVSPWSTGASATPRVPTPTGLRVVGNVAHAEISFSAVDGAEDYVWCASSDTSPCFGVSGTSTQGKLALFTGALPPSTSFFAVEAIKDGCPSDPTPDVQALLDGGIVDQSIPIGNACTGTAGAQLAAGGIMETSSQLGLVVTGSRTPCAGGPVVDEFWACPANPQINCFGSTNHDLSFLIQSMGNLQLTTANASDVFFFGYNGSFFWQNSAGTFSYPSNSNLLGIAVAQLGFTAGGNARLAMGAPGTNAHTGAISVYDFAGGSSIALETGLSVPGDANSSLGAAVATIGDVDGDGQIDFVTGAPGWTGGTAAGTSVTLRASGQSALPVLRTWPGTASEFVGNAIVAIGDTNGDGLSEFVTGAAVPEVPGFVAFADPTNPNWLFSEDGTGPSGVGAMELGGAVTAAGDADGDGVPDYAYTFIGSEIGNTPAVNFILLSGQDSAELGRGSRPSLESYSLASFGNISHNGVGGVLLSIGGGFGGLGSVDLFVLTRPLSLTPSETLAPDFSGDGLTSVNFPVSASPTIFTPSGGSPPYALNIANNVTGGSISEFTYTPGALAGVDTIRVTDAKGRSRDTRVSTSAPSGLPRRPLQLSSQVAGSAVALQWIGNEASYVVEYRRATGSWTPLLPVNDLSTTLTGLPAHGDYRARVKAENSIGDSLWSNEATFSLP